MRLRARSSCGLSRPGAPVCRSRPLPCEQCSHCAAGRQGVNVPGALLFNSPLYGAFLVACFFVFWSLRSQRLARAVFLVVASYGFYFYGTLDTAREQHPPLGPIAWSILCLGVI